MRPGYFILIIPLLLLVARASNNEMKRPFMFKEAKLPAGFVESLKSREVNGSICKPEMPFRIGQQVSIRAGVFDGSPVARP